MNDTVLDWYEDKEHIDEMKGWDRGELKIWEQQVTNIFPKGVRILDIGSGMGREAFALHRQGFEVTGIDISKYAVDKANEEAVGNGSNVKFYHYDGEHIPFEDNLFDVVIIWSQTFGLLYGDAHKESYLLECKRVLRLGGLLSYSGHSLQYIRANHPDCLEENKFYPYKQKNIYWETFSLEGLEYYSKQLGFDIMLSGEGEIYVPEDGTILYCLSRKKESVK